MEIEQIYWHVGVDIHIYTSHTRVAIRGDTCYSRFTQKFDLAAGAGLNSVFFVMLSETNSLPAWMAILILTGRHFN